MTKSTELSSNQWRIMLICYRLGRVRAREVMAHWPGLTKEAAFYLVEKVCARGYLDKEKGEDPDGRATNFYLPNDEGWRYLRSKSRNFVGDYASLGPNGVEMLQEAFDKGVPAAERKRQKEAQERSNGA